MKAMLGILATLVFTAIASGDTPVAPSLVVSESRVDFGTVDAADGLIKSLTITNTSPSAVDLQQPKSSCGCTSATLATARLESGQSSKLSVRLDLAKYASNRVDSTVFIATATPDQQSAEVKVTAAITPELVVEPASIDFGVIHDEIPAANHVTLVARVPESFALSEINAPDWLEVVREENGLAVKLRDNIPLGTYSGNVELRTNLSRQPNHAVKVSAIVAGVDYQLKPRVLFVSRDADGAPQGQVSVLSDGPMSGSVVSDTVDACDFELISDDTQKAFLIRLVPGSPAIGVIKGQVTIRLARRRWHQDIEIPVFGKLPAKSPG